MDPTTLRHVMRSAAVCIAVTVAAVPTFSAAPQGQEGA
jgi:hypothetical protein